MGDRQSVNELELLAYADGLLDADPVRKAAVEARLRQSPEDAERVRAYQSQNEALRRRYGPKIEEPVPARLYAALDGPARRPWRGLTRLAAAGALLFAVGWAGWLVGQTDRASEWSAEDFVRQSYRNYQETSSVTETTTASQTGTINAMHWLSERIALSLKVPDLSGAGYVITDRQTLTVGDNQFVRLTYTGPGGRGFDLFLQPRWENSKPGIRVAQEEDVSLAYWFDGPLAHAVVSKMSPTETRELALAIRRAMHDTDESAPAVELTPSQDQAVGVAEGEHVSGSALQSNDADVLKQPPVPGRTGKTTMN